MGLVNCASNSKLCLILFAIIWQIVTISGSDFDFSEKFNIILDRLKRESDSNQSDITTIINQEINLTNSSSEKNTSISWSDISDNFNKYLPEDEVQEKWNSMEQKLKSGVRTLLRTIFPRIVAMSSDAKVSGNCSAGILKWIVSLRHLKSWAVKMLDATGKPPSGIFEGVVTMFGNYEECVKVRVSEDDDTELDDEGNEAFKEFFRGQFCVAEFKPWLPKKPPFYGMNSKIKSLLREADDTVYNDFADLALFFHFITFRVDLCVPSTCTREDIQRVASLMAKGIEFRARVMRCEVASDNVRLNNYQITSILILLIIFIAVICSTLVMLAKRIATPRHNIFKLSIIDTLSLLNSWKELFSSYNSFSGLKPVSLYGMRTIITIWIIVVHTMVVVDFQYFREMQYIKTLALKWPMQIFTNSLIQFESLIIISAFSLSYYNVGKSPKEAILFVIKKYLRLTPVIILISIISILLPALLQRGPLTADFISSQAQTCQNSAFKNLLYIQNFFTIDTICSPHTWIFCVEMQLSIIFIPIIIFYNSLKDERTRKLFWISFIFFIFFGFIINASIVYIYQLPPNLFWTLPDPEQRNEYFYLYYYKPWTHLSVYAIGFYAGVLRRSTKSKLKGPYGKSVTSSTGWCLSIITILALIYGCHDWVINELPDAFTSALYDGMQKIFWSLANCWILFTITTNSKERKSILERFFSHNIFVFIGRLTLLAYLIHPIVQLFLLSTQQQHLYSSTVLMAYIILGNITFTYLISFILSWILELPVSSLFSSRIVRIKYNTDHRISESENSISKSQTTTTSHIASLSSNELEMDQTKNIIRL